MVQSSQEVNPIVGQQSARTQLQKIISALVLPASGSRGGRTKNCVQQQALGLTHPAFFYLAIFFVIFVKTI